MDDKLINLIATVVILGIWAVQFFMKSKSEQEERHFDEDTDEEAGQTDRPPASYAEDPYIKVQEEIRRKIAERKAAQQSASPDGQQNTQQTRPQTVPQAGSRTPPLPQQKTSLSTQKELQPSRRELQQPASSAANRQQAQTIDEIRRHREQAPAVQGEVGQRRSIAVDRQLRPIPQAGLPDRNFPVAQAAAAVPQKYFPGSHRSGQAAYHGSTRLRREPNARNAALKAALHTTGSTRQAILLQEILGKPVGLRSDHFRGE